MHARRLNFLLLFFMGCAAAQTTQDMNTAGIAIESLGTGEGLEAAGAQLQQGMIWLSSAPEETQLYAVFRKTFDLPDKPASATLHLFADSRYILWVNGHYVSRGPCRFDPSAPEFDTLDVARYLDKGANVIAILVHHYHDGRKTEDPEALNGRTMRHAPCCAASLVLADAKGTRHRVETGPDWRAGVKTRFLPSPVSWGNIPDRIDARIDAGDWTQAGFDDSAWQIPVPVDGSLWGALKPRALPLLREEEIVPARVLRQDGVRGAAARELRTALPITLEAKQEAVLDVGQTVVAYDVLDLDAGEGAELQVVHGHGYAGGKLDETYDCNRYIARAGRQVYMSGDTIGFRYMLVRVLSGKVTLHGIKVVNRVYPFEQVGRFACNDAFLNELWTRSVHTVQLCSEDGYEDCNSRERTEWMGDAALSEYPVTRVALASSEDDGTPRYGDPLLIRNMLRHIAQSQTPDGRIKAHHPSNRWDIHGYIEDYACLWVQTLRAYFDNTNNIGEVRSLWPTLTKQLQWFLDRRSERGLVKGREFVFFDNPLAYKVCEGATLNAYVYGALLNAAYLGDALGEGMQAQHYREAANALKSSLNSALWDADACAYHGGILEEQKTEANAFAAMLPLYYGLAPRERAESVLNFMIQHRAQLKTPFVHHFFFEVLYRQDRPELDTLALDTMRERWASTLARTDLDTVFEGFGGPCYCHNMGAPPAYFLSAYVLGVRREGPLVEQRILIEPHPGNLKEAEGRVATELGPVDISWKWDAGSKSFGCQFTTPVRTVLMLPRPRERATVVLDGKALSPADMIVEGCRIKVACDPGAHAVSVL